MTAINRAFYISAAISAVLVAIAAFVYLPGAAVRAERRLRRSGHHRDAERPQPALVAIGAVVIGIVLAASSRR